MTIVVAGTGNAGRLVVDQVLALGATDRDTGRQHVRAWARANADRFR